MEAERVQSDNDMETYGLIGYPLGHSFSKKYFTEKFENQVIQAQYLNFESPELLACLQMARLIQNLKGLNVTIPYKRAIMEHLSVVDAAASEIGAVNVIQINASGEWIGYNTDWIGFKDSIQPLLKPWHAAALILGNGGVAQAVKYALNILNIPHKSVIRGKDKVFNTLNYIDLNEEIIESHQIIINCTPLGMFPHIEACPDIPYHNITNKHICFDTIYNPADTKFMQLSAAQGAQVINGLEMLYKQAEAAWNIWNQ